LQSELDVVFNLTEMQYLTQ